MKTLTLPEAQANLHDIIRDGLQGETISIDFEGRQIFAVFSDQDDWPPVRPPGYFADIYDDEDCRIDNLAAQFSPPTYAT